MAIMAFVKHVESLQSHQSKAQSLRFDQQFNQKLKSRPVCAKQSQLLGDDLIKLKNLLKKVMAKYPE